MFLPVMRLGQVVVASAVRAAGRHGTYVEVFHRRSIDRQLMMIRKKTPP